MSLCFLLTYFLYFSVCLLPSILCFAYFHTRRAPTPPSPPLISNVMRYSFLKTSLCIFLYRHSFLHVFSLHPLSLIAGQLFPTFVPFLLSPPWYLPLPSLLSSQWRTSRHHCLHFTACLTSSRVSMYHSFQFIYIHIGSSLLRLMK